MNALQKILTTIPNVPLLMQQRTLFKAKKPVDWYKMHQHMHLDK